jgi:hypothetical protein
MKNLKKNEIVLVHWKKRFLPAIEKRAVKSVLPPLFTKT